MAVETGLSPLALLDLLETDPSMFETVVSVIQHRHWQQSH